MSEETECEKALREFCEQYTGGNTIVKQVRDNLAMLSQITKEASVRAATSSESAGRLAASLNRLTFWLVVVGFFTFLAVSAQTVVSVIHH